MYNVCSNSMSTLHKYLKYTLDMYLFLLPSFLSLRPPASDTVLVPEVIQTECCSSSAQLSSVHQLTTFTLAVSNVQWSNVSILSWQLNGTGSVLMVLCLNVQIVRISGKLRLLPPDRVSETFEQVRVVQVTLEHFSLSILCR